MIRRAPSLASPDSASRGLADSHGEQLIDLVFDLR